MLYKLCRGGEALRRYWPELALLLIMLLVFSPILYNQYLFEDEAAVGAPQNLFRTVLYVTLDKGRPLTGLIHFFSRPILYTHSWVLPFIRLLCILGVLGLGKILYDYAYTLYNSKVKSFLLAGLVITLPAFLIHGVFSVLLPYFLGLYAAYFSYASYRTNRYKVFTSYLSAGLLLIGYCCFQATPFFALVFLFLDLLNEKQATRETVLRTSRFLVLFLAVLVFYTGLFKLRLFIFPEEQLYEGAQAVKSILNVDVNSVTSLMTNIKNEWGVFHLVNPPVLLSSQEIYILFYSVCMLVFVSMFAYYCRSCLREKKSALIPIFLCSVLFLSLLPLVSDGFSGRCHLRIAVQPLLTIFILHVAFQFKPQTFVIAVLSLWLALNVVGAYRLVNECIVLPGHRAIQFIENETRRQYPRIKPGDTVTYLYIQDEIPFYIKPFKDRMQVPFLQYFARGALQPIYKSTVGRSKGFYVYAAGNLGLRSEVYEFNDFIGKYSEKSDHWPQNTVFVDWNKLLKITYPIPSKS